MAKKPEIRSTNGASQNRLDELEAKIQELRQQRRKLTSGLSASNQDKVEAILSGHDVSDVIGPKLEAIESIDGKIAILTAAQRKQHNIVEGEQMIIRRVQREKDRPAYVADIQRYYQAVEALQEAEQALRGHEAFRLSPIFFPGLSFQNFKDRLITFAGHLRTRGIDPAEVGVDLPKRSSQGNMAFPQMSEELRAKRYPKMILHPDLPA